MPTPTYDLIASNVLSSSASSVTFSSIPATYRDLVLVCEGRLASGIGNFRLALNSSTANFTRVFMTASSGGTASGTSSTSILNENAYLDDTNRVLCIAQIMDYSATDKHKSILSRANSGSASISGVDALALRWASTSAVTSVTIDDNLGNSFASGSTFYLFGIVS